MEDNVSLLSGKEVQWKKATLTRKLSFVSVCICVVVLISAFCAIRWRPVTIPKSGVKICSNDIRVSAANRFCDRQVGQTQVTTSEHGSRYKHILVDDKHRMLYCVIPGTGYGSIIALLGHHTGHAINGSAPPNVDDPEYLSALGFRYLESFTPGEINRRLSSYLKFVLVRHPFVRLKSAFSDIFVGGSRSAEQYEDAIVHFYGREKLTWISGHPKITFYQFLQLIIGSKEFQDLQWKTYYSICHPCHLHYDVILKLETIQNDIRSIVDRLKNDEFGEQSSFEVFWNTNDLLKYNVTSRVFQTVPVHLLDRILKHYKKDMRMFGYTWSDHAGIKCKLGLSKEEKCC